MIKNIYNFNQKEFMIGVEQAVKHIITKKELQNSKIISASQDRTRE